MTDGQNDCLNDQQIQQIDRHTERHKYNHLSADKMTARITDRQNDTQTDRPSPQNNQANSVKALNDVCVAQERLDSIQADGDLHKRESRVCFVGKQCVAHVK